MGFWLFMLIMDLLIPLTMISLGKYFMKKTPKKINVLFGYRSAMSMKNQETWIFAHHYCGRLWFVLGMISLPISFIIMALTYGKSKHTISLVGLVLCIIQLFPLVGSILPTERALKKEFDQNGIKRC